MDYDTQDIVSINKKASYLSSFQGGRKSHFIFRPVLVPHSPYDLCFDYPPQDTDTGFAEV